MNKPNAFYTSEKNEKHIVSCVKSYKWASRVMRTRCGQKLDEFKRERKKGTQKDRMSQYERLSLYESHSFKLNGKIKLNTCHDIYSMFIFCGQQRHHSQNGSSCSLPYVCHLCMQ